MELQVDLFAYSTPNFSPNEIRLLRERIKKIIKLISFKGWPAILPGSRGGITQTNSINHLVCGTVRYVSLRNGTVREP